MIKSKNQFFGKTGMIGVDGMIVVKREISLLSQIQK